MPRSTPPAPSPYQPSLLRLIHGVTGLLVLLLTISGYWIYNQFDGRWGKLTILPSSNSMIGFHYLLGSKFTLVPLVLLLYSVTLGRRKLIQPNTFKAITADRPTAPPEANQSATKSAKLSQQASKRQWFGWGQVINTFMLLAIGLAWISGRRMDDVWLTNQDFNHWPYWLHLASWLIIGVGIGLHVLTHFKVGGMPLLISIYKLAMRKNDRPQDWFRQITQVFRKSA
jgi:Prokaryotic cytochrome b561